MKPRTGSPPTTYIYRIVGQAVAQFPLRVLNHFARLELCLDQVSIERSGGVYEILIRESSLESSNRKVIIERLRQAVLVLAVEGREVDATAASAGACYDGRGEET